MKRTLLVIGVVAVWEASQYGTRWLASWVMEDFNREFRRTMAARQLARGIVVDESEEEDWWM